MKLKKGFALHDVCGEKVLIAEGIENVNFSKMINNETKSIRYENIEAMCLLFDCTPNELFEFCDKD